MSRHASSILVVPLVLAMALPASAGEASAASSPPALARGARVRLTSVDRSRVEGYLLEADEAQIRLRGLDGADHDVKVSELIRIEVARRSRLRAAAGGGLLAGTIFGFAGLMALGLDQMAPRAADGKTCHATDLFAGGYEYQCMNGRKLAGYVGAGVALGAILGAWTNPERYVGVQAGRFGVRVVPAPKGAAVQASVGF